MKPLKPSKTLNSLKLLGFASVMALQSSAFYVSNPATATGSSCVTSDRASSSFIGEMPSVKDGDYDVYFKLPKRGQKADVSIQRIAYDSMGDRVCKSSSKVSASGDAWTKVSRWKIDEGVVSTIELVSSKSIGALGANRPAVMLVSAKSPVCRPAVECMVSIGRHKGTIIPTSTDANDNELVVTVPHLVNNDELKSVDYYVDDKLAYTTNTLEDFDMRYASYVGQKLVRLLSYSSGQQVAIEEFVPASHRDSFGNFVFRVANTNVVAARTATLIFILALLIVIVRFIVKLFMRRRNWRIAHGFVKEKPRAVLSREDIDRQRRMYTAIKYGRLIAKIVVFVALAVSFVSIVMSDVIMVNQVNGVSMESTLKDGQYVAINKAPATFNRLTSKQYQPNRGTVVVVDEVYGHHSTGHDSKESDRRLIKRVIGLPGERIVAGQGTITVYNKDNPKGFNPDKGSGWENTMIKDLSSDTMDIKLLQNEVFVIGDNRLTSIDSRMNGPISSSNILGELLFAW